MKTYEFYRLFANTPIKDREKVVSFNESKVKTLSDIFTEIQKLEDIMRPYRIQEDKLLAIAESFFESLMKKQ